jgi:threonine dehydrogenase-like Zn-dependent dehydrogenase
MRYLQILEPGKAELKEGPVPEPGKMQVLVKILAVTTCPHWDLHLADGEPMFPGLPLAYPYTPGQPGHEAMGEVVEAGPGVIGLSPGAKIVAWRDQGHNRPGCYAQYAILDAVNVLEIPAHTQPVHIAPLELAMCVRVSFGLLEKLDVVKAARFAVGGLGPAGLIAVQMAKASGADHVAGIDPIASRRELALELGADAAYPPRDKGLPSDRFTPQSFHAAIDCTGLRASIEYLMDATDDAVALFGVVREDLTYGARHRKALALLGYRYHNRVAAEEALALVLTEQVRLSPLVTHTLPLSEYGKGVELLRNREALKVCFLPWE